MQFAPDTVTNLEFMVALADTRPTASRSGDDELTTVAELDAFLDQWPWSGRRDHDQNEVDEVRATRDVLPRLWTLSTDDAVEIINEMLADARALPYLAKHDGLDWHLHATAPDAPLAERIRVEIAMALIDVVRSGEQGRLRVCEADDCEGLFVDLSRNGSKRFCSVRCGNRMNMVAFRERSAGVR
ncbi:MAG: CGNR zinc finger domain-containing protein [Pseudolysinimonas sp.]